MITVRLKHYAARAALGLALVAGGLEAFACTRRHLDEQHEPPDAGLDAAVAGRSTAGRDAGDGGGGRGGRASLPQEPCCMDQRWQSCACPAGVCNFALGVATCADGSCRVAGDPPCAAPFGCLVDSTQWGHSKPPDADAGMGWHDCCLGGRHRLCFQAPDQECHYGRDLKLHADGTCEIGGIADLDAGP